MLEVLYWEPWFQGDVARSVLPTVRKGGSLTLQKNKTYIFSRKYICPGGEETVGPCPLAPEERNILYENRILGLPRYILSLDFGISDSVVQKWLRKITRLRAVYARKTTHLPYIVISIPAWYSKLQGFIPGSKLSIQTLRHERKILQYRQKIQNF